MRKNIRNISLTRFIIAKPMTTQDYTDWDNMEYNPETGEFEPKGGTNSADDDAPVVKDSLGVILKDGDQVKVIKDLKIKGMSKTLKRGVDNYKIKLIPGNTTGVDCKIGKSIVELRADFLKKV